MTKIPVTGQPTSGLLSKMKRPFDLTKTQFLAEGYGPTTVLRAFRRKSAMMLFNGSGQPIRLISWEDWGNLKSTYPAEVASEGLTCKNVWTLEEIKTRPTPV
ncbi:hypothetical protein [Pararhizobium sp. A13]|uniref:hypothetical protein n=1 Tax=Pararhizobium sp. A13 TaxID=3133975 RepID=UPI00324AFB17